MSGERYRVPSKSSTARCSRCGLPIIWTTDGGGAGRRIPIPLDASTVEEAGGVRWGRDHRNVCRPGRWPLTMEFPAGAIEPLANPAKRLPDGGLSVTFANRWDLYDSLVVTGLACAIGARVTSAERAGNDTCVVMTPSSLGPHHPEAPS